jgi:hypothetical protein
MLILSRYPVETADVRMLQHFLWQDMPGARLPDDADTAAPQDWYSPEELAVLPLSSKSHWDVPVNVNGEIVHILAAHSTGRRIAMGCARPTKSASGRTTRLGYLIAGGLEWPSARSSRRFGSSAPEH